jgi:membrane protease YdiL (CAAX protease family)
MPPAWKALAAAAVVSAIVTVVSRFAPKSLAATGVGLSFLMATWLLTIRHDDGDARVWGLSLGGLLDREKIQWPRLGRETAIALLWVAGFALLFFPPFYFGYRYFWHPRHPFAFRLPGSFVDEIAGQVFVIALPEEAFFRGYLQSALDASWPPRWRVLGADLGYGWIVSAAIFAVGHLLTTPSPARLAVFFPALVFGYLRARTRGIGAGVGFHAACNIYSATLARGFGFTA